jgi:hypothetical protein
LRTYSDSNNSDDVTSVTFSGPIYLNRFGELGIEEDEVGGKCSKNEMTNAYKILVGTFQGKRQFARPRHRWMDIIKTSEGDG